MRELVLDREIDDVGLTCDRFAREINSLLILQFGGYKLAWWIRTSLNIFVFTAHNVIRKGRDFQQRNLMKKSGGPLERRVRKRNPVVFLGVYRLFGRNHVGFLQIGLSTYLSVGKG